MFKGIYGDPFEWVVDEDRIRVRVTIGAEAYPEERPVRKAGRMPTVAAAMEWQELPAAAKAAVGIRPAFRGRVRPSSGRSFMKPFMKTTCEFIC